MNLLRRIRKFAALDRTRKALFVEAFYRLGLARYSILRRPFKNIVAGLELHRGTAEPRALAMTEQSLADCVGLAVTTAARFTPWESACLAQVLAAQHMLQKRGVSGAFYLGATSPSQQNGDTMTAHAWLKCGEQFITGESGHEQYTVVSTFSWS